MINAIAENVTCAFSINLHRKKVRHKTDCYNLHTVSLVIILLLIIIIISYHYAKNIIDALTKKNWKIINFK